MANLDSNYWNNKWPKAPIIYNGRALRGKSDRIGVDVKDFIVLNDELVKNVIKKYKLDQGRTPDDIAWNIQKWVVKFLSYKYDEDSDQCPEFWQFPFETLQSGVGDCEDGAILITSLLANAGIPDFRCKVGAGYVQPSPTAPKGGHAFNLYLADDGEWRILDWCFYEDSRLPVKSKPLSKNGGQKNAYLELWFTFNDKFSWIKGPVNINKGRVANSKTEETTSSKKEVLIESKGLLKTMLKDIDQKYKTK